MTLIGNELMVVQQPAQEKPPPKSTVPKPTPIPVEKVIPSSDLDKQAQSNLDLVRREIDRLSKAAQEVKLLPATTETGKIHSPSIDAVIVALRKNYPGMPDFNGDLPGLMALIKQLPKEHQVPPAVVMHDYLVAHGISDEEMHTMSADDWAAHVDFWGAYVVEHPDLPLKLPEPDAPKPIPIKPAIPSPVKPEGARALMERIFHPTQLQVRLRELASQCDPSYLEALAVNDPAGLNDIIGEIQEQLPLIVADQKMAFESRAILDNLSRLTAIRDPSVRYRIIEIYSQTLPVFEEAAENNIVSGDLRRTYRQDAFQISLIMSEFGNENQMETGRAFSQKYLRKYLDIDSGNGTVNYNLYGGLVNALIHSGNESQRELGIGIIREGIMNTAVDDYDNPYRRVISGYFSSCLQRNRIWEMEKFVDAMIQAELEKYGFNAEDFRRLVAAHNNSVGLPIQPDLYEGRVMRTIDEFKHIKALEERIPRSSRKLYEKRGIKLFSRFTVARLEKMAGNLDSTKRSVFIAFSEEDNRVLFAYKAQLEEKIRIFETAAGLGVGSIDIWEINSIKEKNDVHDFSLVEAITASSNQHGKLLTGFAYGHGEHNAEESKIVYGRGEDSELNQTTLQNITQVVSQSFIDGTSFFWASCDIGNDNGLLSKISALIPSLVFYGGIGTGSGNSLKTENFPSKVFPNSQGGYDFGFSYREKMNVVKYLGGRRVAI